MKVVFFGTPDFSVPSLERLLESRHEVVLVVTRPDKPVGRHKTLKAPPVADLALRRGLQLLQPKGLKGETVREHIRAVDADAAVVVAYGRLIPAALLDTVPYGMVNLHPSLLPRHRGPSPIQWALVCGDRITGVTTMLLDEGMDTGPILLQERMAIEKDETAEQLSQRLSNIGADLVVETLDALERDAVEPKPQPKSGATVTPMLRRDFGEIDWTKPAYQLVNRFRGFVPWPGSYTSFRGGRLKIFGLENVDNASPGDEVAGEVLSADADGIVVRCGRSTAVRITELQREGKRRLPADAFLIGERVSRGERFG